MARKFTSSALRPRLLGRVPLHAARVAVRGRRSGERGLHRLRGAPLAAGRPPPGAPARRHRLAKGDKGGFGSFRLSGKD